MITVVADTHGTDSHRLGGRTLRAVREADLVVHAGDFTTGAVLDAFERVAGVDGGSGGVDDADSSGRESGDNGGKESSDADSGGESLGSSGKENGDADSSRESVDSGGDGTGAGNASGSGSEGAFVAVAGNSDDAAVRRRLAETRVIERAGVRLVVVHGHDHDATTLSFLGRQERADVVVVGHSHRPGWDPEGAVAVLNPGSHADPRRYRPAHAELEPTTEGLSGRLVTPGGEVLEAFDLAVTGHG